MLSGFNNQDSRIKNQANPNIKYRNPKQYQNNKIRKTISTPSFIKLSKSECMAKSRARDGGIPLLSFLRTVETVVEILLLFKQNVHQTSIAWRQTPKYDSYPDSPRLLTFESA